jgi:hypothetical protein
MQAPEMVHYLASRRRNELLAFLDRMETDGVQVSKVELVVSRRNCWAESAYSPQAGACGTSSSDVRANFTIMFPAHMRGDRVTWTERSLLRQARGTDHHLPEPAALKQPERCTSLHGVSGQSGKVQLEKLKQDRDAWNRQYGLQISSPCREKCNVSTTASSGRC